jgi:hypothetical protein
VAELRVPATEVARRARHGVAVLLKIYAHCIDGQADAANQRIADALGTQDIRPESEPGLPVEPGRHTLQVRNGRNSSRTKTFDAAEGEIVAFRCGGKSILPIFLLSFVVPSVALSLHRE